MGKVVRVEVAWVLRDSRKEQYVLGVMGTDMYQTFQPRYGNVFDARRFQSQEQLKEWVSNKLSAKFQDLVPVQCHFLTTVEIKDPNKPKELRPC